MVKEGLVIYEPKGKALEYAPLAVNLYNGCGHGCVYCYAPDATFRDRADFIIPIPRKDIIKKLARHAPQASLDGTSGNVLLCFTCDPYQPLDITERLTRQAIEILHANGFNVTILTKGGKRAERDFDLLGQGDEFATTLTFLDGRKSFQWEPGAALPESRIATLKEAHDYGIKTWVSLEPIIDPWETLEIIRVTHTFADLYKVGKLNYAHLLPRPFKARVTDINWYKVVPGVVATLKQYGCQYYIKKDLREFL